jgi:hypothetical protein
MRPEEQLERLETWYEALISGEYEQARGSYERRLIVGGQIVARCCLNVANEVIGTSHDAGENGAYKALGLILERCDCDGPFESMNDGYGMTFHEIADVVLTEGINPLRAAMGLEPYDEGEEI